MLSTMCSRRLKQAAFGRTYGPKRHLVPLDGCACMIITSRMLNAVRHLVHICLYEQQRQFVRWYDSSTCDIQFLRTNYTSCIKQDSLLKFRKAGFLMKRLISIHQNTLQGMVDLINSDIHTCITLVCSVHS